MDRIYQKTSLLVRHLFFMFSLLLLTAKNAFAQGWMGGTFNSCPMCNNMGWGGMTLGLLMMVAVVAAFIALAVFLVRRGRSSHK